MQDPKELVENKAKRVNALRNTIAEAADLAAEGAPGEIIKERLRERRFEIAEKAPDMMRREAAMDAARAYQEQQ